MECQPVLTLPTTERFVHQYMKWNELVTISQALLWRSVGARPTFSEGLPRTQGEGVEM
jgi:hypothetical protein